MSSGLLSGPEIIVPLNGPNFNPWSAPREPTPGSKFRVPGNPLGSAGGQSRNGEMLVGGDMIAAGQVNGRLRGVHDAQMKQIPNRHKEGGKRYGKVSNSSGKGSLFGNFLSGGTDTVFGSLSPSSASSGVFGSAVSSVISSNGSLIGSLSLAADGTTYGGVNGVKVLNQMGFSGGVATMEDEDEMNTVSGYHSNGQIVGPELLFLSPMNIQCPGDNDLVIQETKAYRPNQSGGRFFDGYLVDLQGTFKNFDGHFGFSLPGFNYYIAGRQKYEPMRSSEECFQTFRLHREIISQYNILGVINAEQHAQGGASFNVGLVSGPETGSAGEGRDKRVNVVFEGMVTIKNIWGPLRGGMNLWLIWKKTDLPDTYKPDGSGMSLSSTETNSRPSSQINKRMFNSNQSEVFTRKPFQLVPYSSPLYTDPPLEALEYTSDHNSWCPQTFTHPNQDPSGRNPMKYRGKAFYIGQVYKMERSIKYGIKKQIIELEKTSQRSMSDYAAGNDELIEILVDTKAKMFMRDFANNYKY